MAIITFISDEGVETTYRVGESEPDIVIGRHRTCNIRTSNQSVSRYHARIFFDGNSYYLQDNESVNGTFYENERLGPGEPVPIEDGKYMLCGNFELRFDYDEEDHARLEGAYEPALEEDPDSTRFGEQYSDSYYDPPAPPPPPPPQAPPPPPPPQAPPPPPPTQAAQSYNPPGYAEPPPRQRSTGQAPSSQREDPVVEGLRADVAQRDHAIGELRAEVAALTKFLDDARNDPGKGQLQQDLDNARRAANEAIAQADELRRQIAKLEERLQEADGQLEDLRRQLAEAAGGTRLEDERHIAALQAELQVLRESLAAAQEKFEEARAGRRNAEELANLQRIRADSADGNVQLLKAELARAQQQVAAAVPASDSISPEEYDAQVAAREEAEERASKAERELQTVKASAARRQADTGAVAQQIAELEAKLAAAEARASQAKAEAPAAVSAEPDQEAARLRIQLKAEKGRCAELQAALQAAKAQTPAVAEADPAELVAAQREIAKLQAELAAASQAPTPAGDGAEVAALRAELDRQQVTNKELQDTISANLKRIQRLTAQASAGGDSDALQKQIQALQTELNAAQAKVRDLLAAPAPAAAASSGNDPQVVRMVSDLNGVVSSFRNDFAAVVDAFDQVRSEDSSEREEGLAQMTESLDNCSMRSQEIKNLLRDLKSAVEGG